MFKNCGKTIQIMAHVFFVLEVIAGLIVGISVYSSANDDYGFWLFIAILIWIGTPLVSYMLNVILYSFGNLVSNVGSLAHNSPVNNGNGMRTSEKKEQPLPEI